MITTDGGKEVDPKQLSQCAHWVNVKTEDNRWAMYLKHFPTSGIVRVYKINGDVTNHEAIQTVFQEIAFFVDPRGMTSVESKL